ncbi:SpaA isopeptide-forming pilin-related protein [Blautia stercoris]
MAGETYTLAEVTAPSGYEVAADITFTVNKDGTISMMVKQWMATKLS